MPLVECRVLSDDRLPCGSESTPDCLAMGFSNICISINNLYCSVGVPARHLVPLLAALQGAMFEMFALWDVNSSNNKSWIGRLVERSFHMCFAW